MTHDYGIMSIEGKLQELKNLDGLIEDYQGRKEQERNVILTGEINNELEKIDEHFDPILSEIFESVRLLEEEIKTTVLERESSVNGTYQVIYVKGRIIWDSKALDGYAVAHPEIKELRKTGKPSVRIKR